MKGKYTLRNLALPILLGAIGSQAIAGGQVVVCGDEWTLSDSAFTNNTVYTQAFAGNLANFMMGASGNILDTSDNGVHSGVSLGAYLTTQGYTYVKDAVSTFDASLISSYEAIIVGGLRGRADIAANLATLTNYVAGGGNVYVFGGTGSFGIAANEAAAWNPFTTLYGMTLGSSYVPPPAEVIVTCDANSHPLRVGVDKLTFGFGHDVTVSGGAVVALSGGPELDHNIGMVATTALVPEPASLMALGLGGLALIRRRR